MEIDRLSALPEPLIVDILRRLSTISGLKEAGRTAVLSKRWRFLWTEIPFVFENNSLSFDEVRSFVATVSAALAASREAPLHSLYIGFNFDKRFTSDVDSWVDVARKRRTKILSLSLKRNLLYHDLKRNLLYHDKGPHPFLYVLPRIIYSLSSLSSLLLCNCFAPPPAAAVEWGRLKMLQIEFAELTNEVVEAIVSGSPLLRNLSLSHCGGFDRLEIGGRSFRYLTVEFFGGEGMLEISAPYAIYFGLTAPCKVGRKVRVRDAPSLESAFIELFDVESDYIPDAAMGVAVEVFEDLRHVKTLHISHFTSEVLSIMATRGFQLPQLKAERLYISAESCLHSVYGIVAVLESCPFLGKLTICCYEPFSIHGCEPKKEPSSRWGPITRDDLKHDMLRLRAVRLEDFLDTDNSGEPTLTLGRILLKRAPILETMKIVCSTVELDAVEKALLDYPKASTNVSLSFRYFR